MATQCWVLVSFLEAFDGTPQFVSQDTFHGDDVCVPSWCDSPREAHQFASSRSARKFLGHLDAFGVYPINLSLFGFVE